MRDLAGAWLADRERAGPVIEAVWGHGLHRLSLSLYATADAPPDALTTSVRGVLFHRANVMVVSDPGAEHVIPGGRREPGETQDETLAREIGEETGWTFVSAAPFAVMHFHHETPEPDGYPYPYPDFFQPLFVLEAGDHARGRILRDDWETGSRMTPFRRALATLAAPQIAILGLALAARDRGRSA
jgi:8-oxo-dGTP pyrophosphatase MutT (NUDIX family)